MGIESLKMSPFEALYGIECNTPISWDDLVNMVILGPDMLKEMEQDLINIKQKLETSWDRQKSYAKQ